MLQTLAPISSSRKVPLSMVPISSAIVPTRTSVTASSIIPQPLTGQKVA